MLSRYSPRGAAVIIKTKQNVIGHATTEAKALARDRSSTVSKGGTRGRLHLYFVDLSD
jgi:hypothetical protein